MRVVRPRTHLYKKKRQTFLEGNILTTQRAAGRNQKINKYTSCRCRQFFFLLLLFYLFHSSSTCFHVAFCRCRPDGAFPSRTGLTSSHEGINPTHSNNINNNSEKNKEKIRAEKKEETDRVVSHLKSSFRCYFFEAFSLLEMGIETRCRPSRAPFLNGRHKRICSTSS
jgi:hypothetical protein